MNNRLSLHQFLNRRYLIMMALLTGIFTFLVSFMNWSGMDDTTGYYMLYEAEVLSEFYQVGEKIDEFDPGIKEYYWGRDNLPGHLQKLIAENELKSNYATLFTLDNEFVYILPFELPGKSVTFYVVHIFEYDIYAINNKNLRLNFSALAIITFLIILIIIFRLNQKVIKQLQHFDGWLKGLVAAKPADLEKHSLPDSVQFDELVTSGTNLQVSLLKQRELQLIEQKLLQREKEFLASLSHELRTPISVIAAAIALLNKRDTLSSKDKKVVEKLARANGNMKLLTNTILQVWRKQPSEETPEPLVLAHISKQAIQDCLSFCRSELEFNLDVTSESAKELDVTLVQIVINNLLKNACQYAEKEISVQVGQDYFVITNTFDSHQEAHKQQVSDSQLYGFGFGLYLVETICQQQSWLLDISNEAPVFRVEVRF